MKIELTPEQEAAIMSLGAKIIGARGGFAKSAKKAATSAANGKIGGRPPKSAKSSKSEQVAANVN